MDYKKFLDYYKKLEKEDIEGKAIIVARKIQRAASKLDISLDTAIYYGLLAALFSDGSVDQGEVNFLHNVIDELGLEEEKQDAGQIKALFDTHSDLVYGSIGKIYNLLDTLEQQAYVEVYSSVTGGKTVRELWVDLICAGISINGDVDEKEMKFVDDLVNGRIDTSAADNANNSSDTGEVENYGDDEEILDETPPRVIRVGGSLERGEYSTYFSVGAEIEVQGSDIQYLDVRVQLLDSTGFILESFDETIYVAQRGIFHFGKEYRIDCNPSNFKVIVGARERFIMAITPAEIFKVTGIRFLKSGSYSHDYELAAMVENVRMNATDVATDVYVTFYDENDNIVGGAQMDGEILYMNQPDKYSASIDCVSVINKTRTFRWSCDYFSRTRW